jgi:tetratricopeptide (TPR) repeat protein
MIRSKKITRKELFSEPDEFITLTGRLVRFAVAHRTRLGYAGLALAALLLLGSLLGWLSLRNERQAALLWEKASAAIGTAPGAPLPETIPAAAKRDFERLFADHPRSKAGRSARLQYAALSLAAGETAQAIQYWEQALKDAGDRPYYLGQIRRGLAMAHARQGELAAAAAQLETLVATPDAPGRDESLFLLGSLYGRMQQSEKSRAAYDRIIAEHPDSVFAAPAREAAAG